MCGLCLFILFYFYLSVQSDYIIKHEHISATLCRRNWPRNEDSRKIAVNLALASQLQWHGGVCESRFNSQCGHRVIAVVTSLSVAVKARWPIAVMLVVYIRLSVQVQWCFTSTESDHTDYWLGLLAKDGHLDFLTDTSSSWTLTGLWCLRFM